MDVAIIGGNVNRARDNTPRNMGIAIIACCIVLVFFLPSLFAWVDCNTATRNLAYAELCESDARCELSERDLASYTAYLKMQAMTCPRD